MFLKFEGMALQLLSAMCLSVQIENCINCMCLLNKQGASRQEKHLIQRLIPVGKNNLIVCRSVYWVCKENGMKD